MPALRIAADDRGLDDQRFPLPRRAQGTVDDRVVFGGGAWLQPAPSGAQSSTFRRRGHAGRPAPRRPARRTRTRGGRRRAAAPGRGRGTRRSGAPRASRRRRRGWRGRRGRPGADVGCRGRTRRGCLGPRVLGSAGSEGPWRPHAPEGVFEQARIAFRRADEDRDLVERHAALHLVEDPARDLDALAPSPGAEKNRTSPPRHALLEL